MNTRQNLIVIAAVVASMPVLARPGFTPETNERGGTRQAVPSMHSRGDVLNALREWKLDPVTANGWRQVGGEAGWVFEGDTSATTRAAVNREFLRWRANPVTRGGWKLVGGELGAVYVGTRGTAERNDDRPNTAANFRPSRP